MVKKEEKGKDYNKYTRRELLKAGARVGAGAAIYGTLGNLMGRGYQFLKGTYEENIQAPKEKIKKELHNLGRKYDNAKREGKILIYGEKAVEAEENRDWEIERQRINRQRDERQKANQEEISRRGFLKSLGYGYLNQVHQNPIPTLTITGAAYGAAKSTIKAIPRYLSRREIAKLKDKNTEYEERIGILENYQKTLNASSEKETEEIRQELERVGGLLDNAKRASGKLETIVEEPTEDHLPLIAIGLTGLLASFILNISKINGFTIAENISISSISLSMLLFFFSLGLIFIGTMRKKIRIIQKNRYKFSR